MSPSCTATAQGQRASPVGTELPTLVIGNYNYASWSLRPWLFLRHFGIDFHTERIPLYCPDGKAALAALPSGHKVPIWRDGTLVVWDSLAILEQLTERHPELAAWPATSTARAVARSISAEMHSSFHRLRRQLPMNCRRAPSAVPLSPEASADVQRITSIWSHCREHYGGEGDWLFGDFSIADAMYAPVALRFHSYGVALDAPCRAWVDCVLNHPAIQQWCTAARAETEYIDLFEKP